MSSASTCKPARLNVAAKGGLVRCTDCKKRWIR
ncbi:MAG TPA: hypothetical protein DEB46_11085 [Myxococcales bacterium]|nr:hypothetical protein [Myxococcales bacterium]